MGPRVPWGSQKGFDYGPRASKGFQKGKHREPRDSKKGRIGIPRHFKKGMNRHLQALPEESQTVGVATEQALTKGGLERPLQDHKWS